MTDRGLVLLFMANFEKVYGCDPSQAMLDQAKEDYKNHGKYFKAKLF